MGGHLCLRETGSRKARLTSRVGLEPTSRPCPQTASQAPGRSTANRAAPFKAGESRPWAGTSLRAAATRLGLVKPPGCPGQLTPESGRLLEHLRARGPESPWSGLLDPPGPPPGEGPLETLAGSHPKMHSVSPPQNAAFTLD